VTETIIGDCVGLRHRENLQDVDKMRIFRIDKLWHSVPLEAAFHS